MEQRNAVANRLRFLHDKKAPLPPASASTGGLPLTSSLSLEKTASTLTEPQKNAMKPVSATFNTDDFFAMPLSSTPSAVSSSSATNTVALSPAKKEHVDFGAVLAQRRRRAQWLCEMRKKSDKNSDYERFSLEYVLRRRYDVATRARMPHMNETEYKDLLCSAHAEREILYNAMQTEADLGRVRYLLHLQGPWCEKTMTTVREPDLFGRAVAFLLSEVFYSRSMRVRWLAPPPPTATGEEERKTVDCITLEISWDQAMFYMRDEEKQVEKKEKQVEEEKKEEKRSDDLSWLTPLLPDPMPLPPQTPEIATLVVVDENTDDSSSMYGKKEKERLQLHQRVPEKGREKEQPVHTSVVKMSSQQKLAQLRANHQQKAAEEVKRLQKKDVLELLLPVVEEPVLKSECRQHGAYEYEGDEDDDVF